jgi:glycosyltransferase involved in cell wall biosynthesis
MAAEIPNGAVVQQGSLQVLVNGENGLLAEPDPRAVAAAMDTLWGNRNRAREMGEAGRRRIAQLGITWENVLSRLLV